MAQHFMHFEDNSGRLLDPDGIDLPDLEAVKREALKNAYWVMSEDVRIGKLDLNQRIEVEDEAGNVVYVVHFRDILEITGLVDPLGPVPLDRPRARRPRAAED